MERVLVYGMTDNPGGIETYLVNVAKRLKDRVAFDYVTDFPEIAHREEIEALGSKIYFIAPKGKKLFSHLCGFWKLLKAHPEYKTVYFNILDAGAAVTQIVPFILRRKIVTHSHNSDTDKITLHKICKPFLKLFTSKKLACSKTAANYMFGSDSGVGIIPNAIDTEKFVLAESCREEKRAELGVGNEPIICHIGRLSNQKNPLGMLDIFKAVLKFEPKALFMSVGTGEMEAEVIDYAKKIGVEKNVLFLGKRADIPELLAAADVFFLPSFYEGLPIVAIEAQASGLYCLLSDAVTKETDITGRVEFMSLNLPHNLWAEKLLELSKCERKILREKIIDAGYDINHSEKSDELILKTLI